MSDFIESVDDMIAEHFTNDAKLELRDFLKGDLKDWQKAEKILYKLIRGSIAHARRQLEGRKTGTMTFDEAMKRARRGAAVTRPTWSIFLAVRGGDELDGILHYWRFDNTEGFGSGDGWPYKPADEDRAATDWMIYQTPHENWLQVNLFEGSR